MEKSENTIKHKKNKNKTIKQQDNKTHTKITT